MLGRHLLHFTSLLSDPLPIMWYSGAVVYDVVSEVGSLYMYVHGCVLTYRWFIMLYFKCELDLSTC